MSSSSNNASGVQASPYLLPRDVLPEFYDLRIEPDFENCTFSGEEKVRIMVRQPVRQIVLNCAEITIHEALLRDAAGAKLVGQVEYDQATERATITFDAFVVGDDWELSLKFAGILNDSPRGFYRCVYNNVLGEQKVIALTAFNFCDARRAFPCWDEPAFEAGFKISLVISEHLSAISNGPPLTVTPLAKGKKVVEFGSTTRIPTYMVAFVVGAAYAG